MTTPAIYIYDDLTAWLQGATQHIRHAIQARIATRGRCAISLAGGGTPKPIYEQLAQTDGIDWSVVDIFFGDERCVPPDHADSNYKMAAETLLNRVAIPAENVYRIRGEWPPAEAAEAYEATLRAYFPQGRARFDLVLLGMGHDGHTLSLFPKTPAIHETTRWVMAQHIANRDMWRVTLTPPAVNDAEHLLFLATGDNKAVALERVLHGPYDPDTYPAQIIRPSGGGQVWWLVDKAAASQLPPSAS